MPRVEPCSLLVGHRLYAPPRAYITTPAFVPSPFCRCFLATDRAVPTQNRTSKYTNQPQTAPRNEEGQSSRGCAVTAPGGGSGSASTLGRHNFISQSLASRCAAKHFAVGVFLKATLRESSAERNLPVLQGTNPADELRGCF